MNEIFSIPLSLKKEFEPKDLAIEKKNPFKRLFDFSGALIALIICSPLIIITALITKLTSKGPVFYFQERVGLNGKIFTIIKFRSMICNAELNGPQLSKVGDIRITAWGKFMRIWRIDELPQLLNILMGDMSIVGPRPERKYYVDHIMKTHPEYGHLLAFKPGLTSLGMVKFGYAENLGEMITRMQYDLEYIKQISLLNDVKIILLSFRLILLGKGR